MTTNAFRIGQWVEAENIITGRLQACRIIAEEPCGVGGRDQDLKVESREGAVWWVSTSIDNVREIR